MYPDLHLESVRDVRLFLSSTDSGHGLKSTEGTAPGSAGHYGEDPYGGQRGHPIRQKTTPRTHPFGQPLEAQDRAVRQSTSRNAPYFLVDDIWEMGALA